jgi:transposase
MRFVETKTPEQQSCLMLHRTRHLFIRQQTSVINAIRAHLPSLALSHRSDAMVLNNCSMWPPTQVTNGCLRLHAPVCSLLAPSCGR